METKAYLGDSVYAEYANGMVTLTTDNGLPEDPSNTIHLEPEVFSALTTFVKRINQQGGYRNE